MFRLLRIAFWLSIVILLLPGDPERGEDAPSVTVLELMVAARDIVWDISNLCGRNPDLCATGGEVGQIIAEKARYNLGQLTEYLGAADAPVEANTLHRRRPRGPLAGAGHAPGRRRGRVAGTGTRSASLYLRPGRFPQAQHVKIEQLYDDFAFLDDWEDRYRYLIELGRSLEPLPDAERTAANKVSGCASQVWLWTRVEDGAEPRLRFVGDSDAHIVKGLVAVVLALFDGRTAAEIAAIDPEETFRRLDLAAHLSPQRSNGLRSMVARIKADARKVLAGEAPA